MTVFGRPRMTERYIALQVEAKVRNRRGSVSTDATCAEVTRSIVHLLPQLDLTHHLTVLDRF
jgi:hypothetical protein